jgi:hypothetical protein
MQRAHFEYIKDGDVPPLQNSFIYANRAALDMQVDFEFSRNHWAVKEVDLYRFLLRNVRPRRQRPTVFQISEHEKIEPNLVSAMMPFAMSFTNVYDGIRQASENAGLVCRRADDIWENPAIIQEAMDSEKGTPPLLALFGEIRRVAQLQPPVDVVPGCDCCQQFAPSTSTWPATFALAKKSGGCREAQPPCLLSLPSTPPLFLTRPGQS